MPRVPLSLAIRSNQSRHGFEGAARLVNCYAEQMGGDARSPTVIYPIEGLDPWLTPADGEIKCLLGTESYLYGVAGTSVFAIDSSDVITILGTVDDDECYMARNRRNPTTQVGLVVGTGKYYTIEGTTMTLNTDADLPPPTSIDVKDGYFVLPATFGRFFITGEDDATTISALDFGTAQRSPDAILRVIATENDVAIFGETSIEWWQNQPSSTASFPFVPVSSVDLGLRNSRAAAKLNREIMWVANDGTVRRMNGYSGDVISDPAVERAIGSLSADDTIIASAWNVSDAGKTFFQIRSPYWCWVYDVDGDMRWHERKSHEMDTYRVTCHAEWRGLNLAGDGSSGTIYKVSRTYYSEGGYPIQMVVQTPPVDASPSPLFVSQLDVSVIPGQGTNTPARPENETPSLIMSYSDDGGATWSTEQRRSMGQAGQSLTRVRYSRLGCIRRNGRTFKLQISAETARGITGATIDVEKGTT